MKRDLQQQTLTSLRVFKERGEQALSHLATTGADEAFFRILQKRDAAFANFRALDEAAMREGIDIARLPEGTALYQDLQVSHGALTELMNAAMDRVRRDQRVVNLGRRALAQYRTPGPVTGRLRGQG